MTQDPATQTGTIVFQGRPGAFSHAACLTVRPAMTPKACASFEDAFEAVQNGKADLAMIPVENSVAGRVADVHRLLPEAGLFAREEYYHRVNLHLLAKPGVTMEDLSSVRSHVHALGQCRKFLRAQGLAPVVAADTAGAAEEVAASNDSTVGAIASELAGTLNGLVSLAGNIEDAAHNTTRFLVMGRDQTFPAFDPAMPIVTSFIFTVRNMPAALYKCLGGFATNGVNMTKLESYLVDGHFVSAQFFAEVEGHPEERRMQLAFEELGFFSKEVTILGVYPAHPTRFEGGTGLG